MFTARISRKDLLKVTKDEINMEYLGDILEMLERNYDDQEVLEIHISRAEEK